MLRHEVTVLRRQQTARLEDEDVGVTGISGVGCGGGAGASAARAVDSGQCQQGVRDDLDGEA